LGSSSSLAPASSSARVITEYPRRPFQGSRFVPARWSMQTSVWTSSSATLVPFGPGWHAATDVWCGSEGRLQVILRGYRKVPGSSTCSRRGLRASPCSSDRQPQHPNVRWSGAAGTVYAVRHRRRERLHRTAATSSFCGGLGPRESVVTRLSHRTAPIRIALSSPFPLTRSALRTRQILY
jgi:hypothetical protein